jgi:hypothetical protein
MFDVTGVLQKRPTRQGAIGGGIFATAVTTGVIMHTSCVGKLFPFYYRKPLSETCQETPQEFTSMELLDFN